MFSNLELTCRFADLVRHCCRCTIKKPKAPKKKHSGENTLCRRSQNTGAESEAAVNLGILEALTAGCLVKNGGRTHTALHTDTDCKRA